MNANDDRQPPAERRARRLAVARVVEEVLEDLPSDLSDSIRLSSIPHWLTTDLLVVLLDNNSDLADAVQAELEALNLVHQDAEGRLRYAQAIRAYLRTWCRENVPTDYQATNRRALAYFRNAIQVDEPLGAKHVELLYHLLIEDEAAGLAYLREQFEVAQDYHLLEQAERFVLSAAELDDELSANGQAWVRYYQARLDQLYRRGDGGEAVLAALTVEPPDPVLGAFAQWSLGKMRIEQQQWSAAIRLYKQSVATLGREGLPLYGAYVQIAIGDAYRDLAVRSGDLSQTVRHRIGATGNPLRDLQRLPFLVYKWLVRYVPLLPNWYFGTDYQDWIVAYLLGEATHWYRKGEQTIHRTSEAPEAPSVVRVHLLLAELEHRLGRWWRAHRRIAELWRMDSVIHSRYRSALVQLGQGQVLLAEGHPAAEALLVAATAELQFFEDAPSLGVAAQALGEARVARGAVGMALEAYATALDAFRISGDRQARTQICWQLSKIQIRSGLSTEARQQIEQLLASIEEQLYIAHFPDGLLRRFRRLLFYCVLPVNYLLTFAFSFLAFESIKPIEGELRLWWMNIGYQWSSDDAWALLGFTLSPLLLLWIYHLVYSLTGRVSVRLLGHKLVPIEREQPNYILVDSKTITHHEVNQQRSTSLAWQDVRTCVSREYLLRQSRYALFSRILLIGSVEQGSQQIPLSGVIYGYDHLKKMVQDTLAQQDPPIEWRVQNFVMLNIRWLVLAVVTATFLSLYRLVPSWWQMVEPPVRVNLWVTSFFVRMFNWLLLLYPVTLLGRLVWHRMRVPSDERPIPIVATWVLVLGFSLQFVWVLIWVLDLLGYPLIE